MATDTPVQCAWNISCVTYADKFSFPVSRGANQTHNIETDYTINFHGNEIPIIRTKRTFNVSYKLDYALPDEAGISYISTSTGMERLYCNGWTNGAATITVTDDCKIESSTLHYLDQTAKVLLYKQKTDILKLNVTSNETCGFKTTSGAELYHMAKIRSSSYTGSTSTEEWVLIINGAKQILSTSTKELHPFGPKNTVGSLNGYAVDPEIREILVFPQPSSQADPQTNDIMALGFYDYGNEPGSESALNKADGGLKDMFYPEWCRNLSPDSIWQQMADRRYELSWYHEPIVANAAYTPPEITVDPIPIGSYAKHPQLEGVYQFLCDGTVYQSSILDTIVDKGSGMYLHYPISLI